MNYEPVIGLEVHIELGTKSKMFCACSADYFGAKPNTHTCPICLGLPGTLPKPNRQAIEYAQKLGLALGSQVELSSKFDRKNYFYPDLAKGFQISQYDQPFSQKGFLEISTKKIRITRAHLEEDTGKLSHTTIKGRRVTLIDFNRSGVPLLEVVTEPDMNSAQEAKAYAQKLQQIARYLKISDADMEKGRMRIEPNVSLRPIRHPERSEGSRGKFSTSPSVTSSGLRLRGRSDSRRPSGSNNSSLPPYKVELKNINSFRFVEKTIEYEIKRQAGILRSGETPIQETRGWNEAKSQTFSQRTKELAHDYRYFPEPDLPPFQFSKDYLSKLESQLPELPDKKFERFKVSFSLSTYDAQILTRDPEIAAYFEEAVKVGKRHAISPKQIANTIINKKPDISTILPAKLIQSIISQVKTVSVSQEQLEKVIDEVLNQNQKAVEDFKNGKQNAIMFLMGQVMRKINIKIDMQIVKKALIQKIMRE